MKHEIVHGPSFALLKVGLEPGESITAEAGAMVTRDAHVQMKTRLNAGKSGFFGRLLAFFVAMIRKVIGGETMFINEFSAEGTGGMVRLAPSLAGQVIRRRLENETIILQTGAYLASTGDLKMKLKWGGLRGILAKEGIVFLKISGTGELFMNAYGGIQPVQVDGEFVVDNGHIVAFDDTLDYKITTPGGGMMGLFASGEGLVCRFRGRGTVFVQSRNMGALVGWLVRLMP